MKIIAKAQKNYQDGRQTILFLDEIHRWSKSQQDVLLPWVEKGIMTLIGATTENPSFTVINALLSRCRTYILEPISETNIIGFMEKNMSRIQERYPNIIFESHKKDQKSNVEVRGEDTVQNFQQKISSDDENQILMSEANTERAPLREALEVPLGY